MSEPVKSGKPTHEQLVTYFTVVHETSWTKAEKILGIPHSTLWGYREKNADLFESVAKDLASAKQSAVEQVTAQAESVPAVPTFTATDKDRFDLLEARVSTGWITFREVGEALREIKEKSLYLTDKKKHYQSWDDYCRRRWSCSDSHADRQVRASQAAQHLDPEGKLQLLESQLRPLTKLKPEQMSRAWLYATSLADGDTIRAVDVEHAVRTISGAKRPDRRKTKRMPKKIKSACDLIEKARKALEEKQLDALPPILDHIKEILWPYRA